MMETMTKKYLSSSDDICCASIIKPYTVSVHFFKLKKQELMFLELFVKQMVYSQKSVHLQTPKMLYKFQC